MEAFLLQASIWGPLLFALPLIFGAHLPRNGVKAIAFIGFLIPLVSSLYLWTQFPGGAGGEFHFRSSHDLGLAALAGIRLDLGLNGISLPFFVLAGVVGFAAGLYAIQSQAERPHLYLLLLLVMQGGLMGVFSSIDIFFFYLFHEFAMIPTFIMIGIWGGRDRGYAAMKMAVYLTLGAMLSLAGLILVYVNSGADSFNLEALRAAIAAQPLSVTVQHYGFGLLLFGFGILVSLWPLHTWAPLGYGAAPTANAMLHAGVLKKFGIYGFVQIAVPLMPQGSESWQMPLAWLALANVVLIGYVTVAQKDLKQMIGYSSVMHMGYCFLGVACLTAVGAGGAVLLCVAHGLSVAVLFLLATCIHHRSGTFEMDEMGGLVYGENGPNGQFGSLTWDKVRGDQTIGFRHIESEDGSYLSGISMWQQPNIPSEFDGLVQDFQPALADSRIVTTEGIFTVPAQAHRHDFDTGIGNGLAQGCFLSGRPI